jgi:hypothetical protein
MREYHVTTTCGVLYVYAKDAQHAVLTALELVGGTLVHLHIAEEW